MRYYCLCGVKVKDMGWHGMTVGHRKKLRSCTQDRMHPTIIYNCITNVLWSKFNNYAWKMKILFFLSE